MIFKEVVKALQLTSFVCKRTYSNRNLLNLKERGLISDVFPDQLEAFRNLCVGKPQCIYAGFDPTAESLHVGNLAVLIFLMQCQRAGHEVIALIGGATGLVGDPSDRKTERPQLQEEIVMHNCSMIKNSIEKIFKNHEHYFWKKEMDKNQTLKPSLRIVNNLDWYRNMKALHFISDIGRSVRLSAMLAKQSVKSRLETEEGMTFTEFSYQILQAYDWLHLYESYKCKIQVGGHDQMGNIKAGFELVKRIHRENVYGLTVPLIISRSGQKFGKSDGNAVWLNWDKTNPFDLYQYFYRSKDDEVESLLYIFTFYSSDRIESIMTRHKLMPSDLWWSGCAAPENHHAQRTLAQCVTLLVHGQKGLDMAERATKALYSESVEALSALNHEELLQLFSSGGSMPSSVIRELLLEPGTSVLDMALKAKCFRNEKDAVRIIQAGGFYLNYRRISNSDELIVPGIHILPNKVSLVRVGKKSYYLIKWSPCS